MIERHKRRGRRALVWLAAAVAAGIVFCLYPRAPEETIILYRGCALRPGAPYAREETLHFPGEITPGALSLIDKNHPLAETASGARRVTSVTGQYLPVAEDVTLMPEVIYALCDLRAARALDGMVVTAGARSFAEQTALRREAFERCAQVYSPLEAARRAEALVPGAGESEHQSGWALDIELTGALEMGLSDRLSQSDFGKWLKENMGDFGFIERYPHDKSACFASSCEGLHLRYVGRGHALAMRALDLCLEEYLDFLRRNKTLLITDNGRETLMICLPETDARTLLIPKNAALISMGGDNAGYVVFELQL